MDPNLSSQPLMLPISMLGVFVATTAVVMVITTPYDTPARRLARYARLTGRPGSPGYDGRRTEPAGAADLSPVQVGF